MAQCYQNALGDLLDHSRQRGVQSERDCGADTLAIPLGGGRRSGLNQRSETRRLLGEKAAREAEDRYHMLETLADFDKSVTWLKSEEHDPERLHEAVLQVIASLDPHGIRASAIKDNPPARRAAA